MPISISSETSNESKKLVAHAVNKIGEKVKVGHMEITSPKKGISATLVHVKTEPHFRQKGVAGSLFNHALEELGAEGKKFIRTDSIIHPATAKILGNKQTKFIGQGMGIHGSESKKITTRHAEEASKKIFKGTSRSIKDPANIISTTMIPKKFRSK